MKEFMGNIPLSVIIKNDYNDDVRIDDDENIFTLSVDELINVLRDSSEFYKNPTKKVMIDVLTEYVNDKINDEKEEIDWYIKNAMPEFLKGDLVGEASK